MRIIDAEPFDNFIIRVPDDVYDAFSYIRGVEDLLHKIRSAETVITHDSLNHAIETAEEKRTSDFGK